jgi:predicted phage-related endonuclease
MLDHNLRKLAIGGSEIGAILGIDPDRDAFAIWAQKRGGLQPMPEEDRPMYMWYGRLLEEGVLRIYQHITGRPTVYCNDSRVDPERPWMVWTPDGLCKNERRGVDAKVVRWDQGYKWGETSDDIPPRIVAQCWWYMAASDYNVWDVVALIGGQDVRIYQIDRDLEAEREMLFRAAEFYRRYLIGDEIPAIGQSREAERWLKQMFPRQRTPLRDATSFEELALNEYSNLRIHEARYNVARERAEVRLKMLIADAEGLKWPAGRVTYRATKDGIKTDWEAMAYSLMQTMTPEERNTEIARFSATRPGHRRLLWDCDETLLPTLADPLAARHQAAPSDTAPVAIEGGAQ